MTILKISELNKGWGICGFASALGALHQNGVFSGTIDHAVKHNQLNTSQKYIIGARRKHLRN